jgi:hypothetical protein
MFSLVQIGAMVCKQYIELLIVYRQLSWWWIQCNDITSYDPFAIFEDIQKNYDTTKNILQILINIFWFSSLTRLNR